MRCDLGLTKTTAFLDFLPKLFTRNLNGRVSGLERSG